jgi:hypothetical protein
MAKWWWVAIEYANKAGLIKAPKPFPATSGNTCEKAGSGQDDGIYSHDRKEMGVIWSYTSEFDRGQVS